jgi:hypothetical protein
MRDLSNIQILAGIILAFATGAVLMDVTFGRLDRIRRHQAEERAARLQKRLDRIEAERALRRRPLRCDEVAS